MSITEENPGVGTYTCINCGQIVILDDDTTPLLPCPFCSGTEYTP